MPRERKGKFREYSPDYKEIIKQTWYTHGRPDAPSLREIISADEQGRKPNAIIMQRWRRDEMWDFWADELDSKALTLAEDNLIQQKAEMLKRHAQIGWDLQTEGMKFLKDGGFDSSAAAVSAVIKGAQLERESRGIGETIVKMAQMTNEELKDAILKKIRQAAENGQIIDAEPVEKIDAESTDKE